MPATAAPKKKSQNKKPSKTELSSKQIKALEFYSDLTSPTFGNMKGSFIRAGFTESYADNILSLRPKWLSGFIGDDQDKLAKVERNIHKFLDLETEVQAMGAFGPIFEHIPTGEYEEVLNKKTGEMEMKEIMTKVPVMVQNTKLLGHQLTMTTFVAERLNRKKYGAKPDDSTPPGVLVQNFTQININPPKEEPVHADVHDT